MEGQGRTSNWTGRSRPRLEWRPRPPVNCGVGRTRERRLPSEPAFLVLLVVGGLAALLRHAPRWAYWASGAVLAAALSGVWLCVAYGGHAVAAPALVCVFPVAAAFGTVASRRFTDKPAWAFIAGVAVAGAAAFVGLVVGANLGVLQP